MSELAKPKHKHHECIALICSLEAERDQCREEITRMGESFQTEMDKLKGELDEMRQAYDNEDALCLTIAKESADWKSKAEKLAEAGNELLDVAQSHIQMQSDRYGYAKKRMDAWKEALAEYENYKPKEIQ